MWLLFSSSVFRLWSPSNSPSCSSVILLPDAESDVRAVRLVRQLSGSRVSRLLSRCSCVNVVSRQTERGTCVSGQLVMFNWVRWPYVWLLDSSESSCSDSSSTQSTSTPPRQFTVSSVPSVVHLQPVGHNALMVLNSSCLNSSLMNQKKWKHKYCNWRFHCVCYITFSTNSCICLALGTARVYIPVSAVFTRRFLEVLHT